MSSLGVHHLPLSVPCVQTDGAPLIMKLSSGTQWEKQPKAQVSPADLGQSHVPICSLRLDLQVPDFTAVDFIAFSSKYALDLYFAFASLPFHKWGTASFSKITELLVKNVGASKGGNTLTLGGIC